MEKQQGLSMIEALIALLIVTGFSLHLLTQAWQANQLVQQNINRFNQCLQVVNQQEELFASGLISHDD